ncbi:hypothetical protein ACFXJ8_26040 [Nonomuraea sp. NPDC059194]|uniref:hypothetical protein n=1 Tax=Nonomuraea sp. NPDC059194 TaxID=3346764 RepID=UPI0036991DA2
MRYQITTPEPEFRGEIAGVVFADGVGVTDNAAALAYFSRKGYGVHPIEDAAQAVEEQDSAPRKSASKAAWVAYAVSQGMAEADAEELTRDQLVERFASDEGEDQ